MPGQYPFLMKAHLRKKLSKRLRKGILEVFIHEPSKSLNYKQVSARLGERDNDVRHLIHDLMDGLLESGELESSSPGRYKLSSSYAQLGRGYISVNRRGMVLFVPEGLTPEDGVEVDRRRSLNVLHGDEVRVKIKRKGKKRVALVIELIHREARHYVGVLEVTDSYAFLIPDNRSLHVDVYIDPARTRGAKDGEKVLVRITDWPDSAQSPFGEVLEILGRPGNPDTEMVGILHEFGLPPDFPPAVLQAAGAIPLIIPDEEVRKRKDIRSICTFTIDPEDAKDFDDAISFERIGEGLLRVGVHIADVTHYVRKGDVIDKEAVKRATSVYLADRVVPMLPEVLSNVVCSLRPNEDKLCFSVLFDMDKEGTVKKHEICRTIIHSDRRFTYEEAQTRIETGEGDLSQEIRELNDIASILRTERMSSGSFDFSSEELRFRYDDDGRPIETVLKIMKDANQLIEEYMLLANRYLARYIKEHKPLPPFIYRNHDSPDPEKLQNLRYFLKSLGIRFDPRNHNVRKEIQQLLDSTQSHPQASLIQTMVIRSMAKADYGVDNIGHYGLSFEDYTHFTSPIRRYPDVLVHRLVAAYMDGQKAYSEQEMQRLARHCSLQERQAVDAERASIRFMQALYLQRYIGKAFMGKVSGVTNFGVFVRLDENHCEGLVLLRSMDDDHYVFKSEQQMVVGQRHGFTYRIGDEVEVRILDADPLSRQVDLVML